MLHVDCNWQEFGTARHWAAVATRQTSEMPDQNLTPAISPRSQTLFSAGPRHLGRCRT